MVVKLGRPCYPAAGYGALAGAVTYGLSNVGVYSGLAAAGGGYAAGYAECGSHCGEQGAMYAFAGSAMDSALTMTMGGDGDTKIPAEGTQEREAMQGRNDVYVITAYLSNPFSIFLGLINGGYSHVWHTQDRINIPEGGRYAKLVGNNMPWPRDAYLEKGVVHTALNLPWNNCATRFGYSSPSHYNFSFNHPLEPYYWWGR